MDNAEIRNGIAASVKSGFTNSPGNPGYPYGGGIGNLGFFCGWAFEPLNCGLPFPDTCFMNTMTRKTLPNATHILFDRQVSFGNGFAPVKESIIDTTTGLYTVAGKKPFLDFGWATLDIPFETIAGVYPISERAMRKCSTIVDRIKETAGQLYLQKKAQQVMSGNGTSPNLRGLMNQAGVVSHVFRGAPYNQATDQIPDAIAEAITALAIAGYRADTVIIHPNNALSARLAKDSQGRPIYTLGVCASTGELFCVDQVCEDPYLTQGTSFTGKFKKNVYLYDDGALRFDIGYINEYFQHNMIMMRWEQENALIVCDAAGIVKTTALA